MWTCRTVCAVLIACVVASCGGDNEEVTPTATVTVVPTSSATQTPPDTPTSSPTSSPTHTLPDTPTATPSGTPTDTPTATASVTPTETPTCTPGEVAIIDEYIRIDGARVAGAPEALNQIGFIRVRAETGNGEIEEADAVIIGQPGFGSAPGIWLELATQLVTKARARGRNIEVWVIDRHENVLEDTRAMRAAKQAGDPRVAFDYYYGPGILGPDGRFPLGLPDDLIAGPGSSFVPILQEDVPFAAEWGFETAAADVEAIMDLLPRERQSSNVFLAGHSQGGGFIANFAGARLSDGGRGAERLAGLIFLDGGPSAGSSPEPSSADAEQYLEAVTAIRTGEDIRFGSTFGVFFLGQGLGIQGGVQALFAGLMPAEESIFGLPPLVAALPEGDPFRLSLRVTNRASMGFTIDDDPIPGAFLQNASLSAAGMRCGHLDFAPLPGTENDCAAPGPFGDIPPCPPRVSQIDPERVYGWLDGGAGGDAGDDGPLNGWTVLDGELSDALLLPGPNPSSVQAFIDFQFHSPGRTNVREVTIDFPVTGPVTIDSGEVNGQLWYSSNRYNTDLAFLGRFERIDLDVQDVRFDIDKLAIDIPVISYRTRFGSSTNPFPLANDFTALGATGPVQSDVAAALSPVDPAINLALYGHIDVLSADDSLAGEVQPGELGASAVSNTLIDWVLARASGTTPVPSSESLGVREVVNPPVVMTSNGPVRGKTEDGVRSFLGIPYAAPPVGELRWRPPRPHDGWTETRDATSPGGVCPQILPVVDLAIGAEDCLFVNVHTPDPPPAEPAPVMVWIHGGGFTVGDALQFGGTDGSVIVRRTGVVEVSLNYRLGPLGFLAHEALSAEDPAQASSGNYGMLDQIAGLEWIRDNIAAFGGDPANVTIFGESAGGWSVCAHLASPLSAGLFHRAIIQSGPCTQPLSSLAAAEAQGEVLAARLGCDGEAHALSCMRSRSVEEVQNALPPDPAFAFTEGEWGSWVPIVDDHVFDRQMTERFEEGAFNHVPVVVGSTKDEGTLFVMFSHDSLGTPLTAEQYPDRLRFLLGSDALVAQVMERYPLANYATPGGALAEAFGDGYLACPTIDTGALLAPHATTYLYQFEFPDAAFTLPSPVELGAFHSAEVQYVFQRPAAPGQTEFTGEELELSNRMLGYWTRFADRGDPNGNADPAWPVHGETDRHLVFDRTIVERSGAKTEACAFWRGLDYQRPPLEE